MPYTQTKTSKASLGVSQASSFSFACLLLRQSVMLSYGAKILHMGCHVMLLATSHF